MNDQRKVAYFSMEIGLDARMPTYSGGLGVLAGDTIRSAADLNIPLIAVTLLHRRGYFYQRLDANGWQSEEPVEWIVEDFLTEEPQRSQVRIEGRTVNVRAWRYDVKGVGGFTVPVYFLDTRLPENSDWDRSLTDFLYGGDQHYRLCQEAILGIGGVRMLRALGYESIERFHMNEGHASLLTLELAYEEAKRGTEKVTRECIEAVRKKCIFTTHTPVPAGHDQFPRDMVIRVVGVPEELFDVSDPAVTALRNHVVTGQNLVNMTHLALDFSHYVNGVAKKHGEVSRLMFGGYSIDSITNGVHAATWTADAFERLYDRYIPGWRQDNFNLRYAMSIPHEAIWQSHTEAKKKLVDYVNQETNSGMDVNLPTIGFGRRAATYKRADLLFSDLARLKSIASAAGPFQIIYAGKAHPKDKEGKEVIQRIIRTKESLKEHIKVAYLENYDMRVGKMMTSGVDVWLNTPQPPMEASGTSGMKAALNGVPSLSILDGWWIEGHIEGVTGWSIADHGMDVSSLYGKLEHVIIPMLYHDRHAFVDIMRHAIALNGSFFNTQRMMQQYVVNAYFR